MTSREAPLLPKLRGHVAEFLNDSSPDRLGTFIPIYQCRFAVRASALQRLVAFLGNKAQSLTPLGLAPGSAQMADFPTTLIT